MDRTDIAHAFAIMFAAVAAVFALSLAIYTRVAHRPLRDRPDIGAGEPA